jgi:hypothetical protein
MARRWLSVWLVILGLAVACWTRAAEPPRRIAARPAVQSGDLVFETSRSSQSAAIQLATASRWSHVGIVEVAPDGAVSVIEALGKVTATPWPRWLARARRGGDVLVLRPHGLSADRRGAAALAARGFLGRPYDARFGWGDDRIYCSELVVKAYERGAGLSFGRRERLGDLHLAGLERAAARRWGGPLPRDLVLVTPASVAEDGRLDVVAGRR